MKKVRKGLAPEALLEYSSARPNVTWEQMNNDNAHGGGQAAHECRNQAIRDQNGLCAYCEISISSDLPRHRRIEHFHPKSDIEGTHNWSLDWGNMLAVCDGGSSSSQDARRIHPLPGNLSCDAHKDRMIQTGKLPVSCEGHLLNPLSIPVFPNLFELDKGTGHFRPNESSCATVEIPDNNYETTAAMVGETITLLNLNCDRLASKRKLLVNNIEHNKKTLRKKGVPTSEYAEKLVNRYFNMEWPEFFTTLRCCLGIAAENYLHSIDYQG